MHLSFLSLEVCTINTSKKHKTDLYFFLAKNKRLAYKYEANLYLIEGSFAKAAASYRYCGKVVNTIVTELDFSL
jgi:hypothetical protein